MSEDLDDLQKKFDEDFEKKLQFADKNSNRSGDVPVWIAIFIILLYVLHVILFFWFLLVFTVYKDEISKDMFIIALVFFLVGFIMGFFAIPSVFFIVAICCVYYGKRKKLINNKYRVQKKKTKKIS